MRAFEAAESAAPSRVGLTGFGAIGQDVVVEVAGPEYAALREHVPAGLRSGRDVITVSVGALADVVEGESGVYA